MRGAVVAAVAGLMVAGMCAGAPSPARAQDEDDGMDEAFCLSGWHNVVTVSWEVGYIAVEDTCDDDEGRTHLHMYHLPGR